MDTTKMPAGIEKDVYSYLFLANVPNSERVINITAAYWGLRKRGYTDFGAKSVLHSCWGFVSYLVHGDTDATVISLISEHGKVAGVTLPF